MWPSTLGSMTPHYLKCSKIQHLSLTSFRLKVHHYTDSSNKQFLRTIMPDRLFNGEAPKLRDICFRQCLIPPGCLNGLKLTTLEIIAPEEHEILISTWLELLRSQPLLEFLTVGCTFPNFAIFGLTATSRIVPDSSEILCSHLLATLP